MAWMAIATIGGALLGSQANKSAAQTQANAAAEATAAQERMYNQTRADQEPFRLAGVEAVNKLKPLLDYQKFGMDQFTADPGYQFRLSEGLKGLDRQAAARGGLISGAALKAAGRYGQDYASNEYTNAFNRYQTERNAQLNPLQSMAGMGQTTAQQLGNAAQNFGNAQANNIMSAGNANASSYLGQANMLNQAIGNYGNYYMQNQRNNNMRDIYGLNQAAPISQGVPSYINYGNYAGGSYNPD
jgi:hypothetical protein